MAAQVRYGNTTDVPSSNATYLGVRLTLTLRYPQPEMVPSEQAAIANIFTQCVTTPGNLSCMRALLGCVISVLLLITYTMETSICHLDSFLTCICSMCRCCNSTDSCQAWKRVNSNSNSTSNTTSNFCKIPGKLQDPECLCLQAALPWLQEVVVMTKRLNTRCRYQIRITALCQSSQ